MSDFFLQKEDDDKFHDECGVIGIYLNKERKTTVEAEAEAETRG